MVWFSEVAIPRPNLSIWGFVSSPPAVEGTPFFPRDRCRDVGCTSDS